MRLYFLPFLMCYLIFSMVLWISDSAGRVDGLNLSNLATSILIGMQTVGFLSAGLACGHFLDRVRHVRRLLWAAAAAILLGGLPVFFVTHYWVLFFLVLLMGFGQGVLVVTFQKVVRDRAGQERGNLLRTLGSYTLAWAMGVAVGYLVSGLAKSFLSPAVLGGVGLLVAGGMVWSLWEPTKAPPPTAPREPPPPDPLAEVPDWLRTRYVAIGWSLVLLSTSVQKPLGIYVTKLNAEADLPSWLSAVQTGGFALCVAGCGYLFWHFPKLLYRWPVTLGIQATVIALLLIQWRLPLGLPILPVMLLQGGLQGVICTSSVFYVNHAPGGSRNVGVNEFFSAGGATFAPILCERIMTWTGKPEAYLPTMAVVVGIVAVFQLAWLARPQPAMDPAACPAVES